MIGAIGERDELSTLRLRAARFFAALLWVHVAIVALVAYTNRMPPAGTFRMAGLMTLAACLGTGAALVWGGSLKARCSIAAALTVAPVLMLAASANAPWQVDYHMYFFVVFGMLVAFVDWRPIAVSAAVTALHHLILARLFPEIIFPEADYERVGLHVAIVLADGVALFWIVHQMTRLFEQAKTSLQIAHEALQNAEMLRSVVSNVNDAVIVTEIPRDADGNLNGRERRVTYINDAFTRMTQFAASDVLGGTLSMLNGERTDLEAADLLFDAVIATGSGTFTNTWYARDGREIDIETYMVAIKTEANVLLTFAVVRDVTENRQTREALLRATIAEENYTSLAFAAVHDALTQLPNRANFRERLNERLARCVAGESEPAVLFIDLDRFKLINAGLGHHSGDLLLVAVAERLRACLREDDILARLGGDEFAVCIMRPLEKQELDRIAQRVLECFSVPFLLSGLEMYASASVGIAHGRSSAQEDADDMLRNADLAMSRAKALGRGRCEHFVPQMLESSARLSQLDSQLRHAIERGEMTTFFQPIVKLSNRRLCGFEALVRWRHPVVGLIPPSEFISIAEDTGLIIELGQFVLDESCAQLRKWLDTYPHYPDLWVGVNVSPLQLREAGYLERVLHTLARHAVPAHQLHLEITESTIVSDFETIAPLLAEIRKSGMHVAIDDFGTGFSSLQYLDKLPVDTLKIDRSFVSGRGDGVANLKIVRTIVNLAKELGLELISEGIETDSQAEVLRTLTRGLGQGYLFSTPLEASAAAEFFEEARRTRAFA